MGARLKQVLGQGWRIFASGVAFSTFGIVGVILSLTVFPLLYLLPLGKKRRQRAARLTIGKCFWLFTKLLGALQLMKGNATELDPLPRDAGRVIIANHPTFTDVVFLIAHFPECICIVKLGVWNNPCMRIPTRAAGYIPNRDAEQLVQDCTAMLKEGGSVLIFPEGSRSHLTGLRKFQRGFAAMAVRAERPVWPIVVTCTPPTLYKGCPWYKMADRCCDLRLKSKEPVDISPFSRENRNDSLAARALTETIERLYQEELKSYYERD